MFIPPLLATGNPYPRHFEKSLFMSTLKYYFGGQSDKDFLTKLSISYKGAREVIYWIKLLLSCSYLTIKQTESILADAEEFCEIIGKIQVTTKKRILNGQVLRKQVFRNS
jgi:hypothetical protein